MRHIVLAFLFITYLFSNEIEVNDGNGNKISLSPITAVSSQSTQSTQSDIKYFKTSNNIIVGIKDKIVIVLNENYSIEDLQNKYQFEIIKIRKNKYFFVRVDKDNILEIVNQIDAEISVKTAYPSYLKGKKLL